MLDPRYWLQICAKTVIMLMKQHTKKYFTEDCPQKQTFSLRKYIPKTIAKGQTKVEDPSPISVAR